MFCNLSDLNGDCYCTHNCATQALHFYERAAQQALLVNGLRWQNPRDGVGVVLKFCKKFISRLRKLTTEPCERRFKFNLNLKVQDVRLCDHDEVELRALALVTAGAGRGRV